MNRHVHGDERLGGRMLDSFSCVQSALGPLARVLWGHLTTGPSCFSPRTTGAQGGEGDCLLPDLRVRGLLLFGATGRSGRGTARCDGAARQNEAVAARGQAGSFRCQPLWWVSSPTPLPGDWLLFPQVLARSRHWKACDCNLRRQNITVNFAGTRLQHSATFLCFLFWQHGTAKGSQQCFRSPGWVWCCQSYEQHAVLYLWWTHCLS